METRVLIRSSPKPNAVNQFDYDWPAGLRDINV